MMDFIAAWRVARRQIAEKRAKDAAYKSLVGEALNYAIIKDLVNAARNDVKIIVTLKDGSVLQILRVDPFDKLEHKQRSELY